MGFWNGGQIEASPAVMPPNWQEEDWMKPMIPEFRTMPDMPNPPGYQQPPGGGQPPQGNQQGYQQYYQQMRQGIDGISQALKELEGMSTPGGQYQPDNNVFDAKMFVPSDSGAVGK